MDILSSVLRMTDEAESPRQFFYWATIAAVSGVVKNNVHLDRFYYTLYPNVYVLLVAKSGLRKGVPVNLARTLVEKSDSNRVIAGRSSVQAIIMELSQAFTREQGGPPITKATAFISSGELSTAFVRDQDALTIMTDLYDGHYNKKWMNTLKGSGKELLEDVCVSLLGALNPTHFNDLITAKEVTGGFLARCTVVQADRRARKNPLTRPPTHRLDLDPVIDRLKILATLKGEFEWTAEAMHYYERWYEEFNPEEYEDETGSLNRVSDTVLKVAMLIALARRGETVLLASDIAEAIRECLPRAKATDEFAKKGYSDIAPLKKRFIQILLGREGYAASRGYILNNYYMDFDVTTLDTVVENLETAKIITVHRAADNHYKLLPEVVTKFKAIMEALEERNVQIKKVEG
jgi:hypothetical protein